MAKFRIAIAAAVVFGALIPLPAAALECKHTLAQHTEALRILEAEAAKARVLADRNPLHESDVAYYDSVLRDARACVRMLGPVVSALR